MRFLKGFSGAFIGCAATLVVQNGIAGNTAHMLAEPLAFLITPAVFALIFSVVTRIFEKPTWTMVTYMVLNGWISLILMGAIAAMFISAAGSMPSLMPFFLMGLSMFAIGAVSGMGYRVITGVKSA